MRSSISDSMASDRSSSYSIAPSVNKTREYLIATRSTGKIREIETILGGDSQLRLLTLEEIGLEPTPAEDEVEIFHTFLENALAKAQYFARITGIPTIADDSGIAVDALGGAPGVRSKRFAQDATRGENAETVTGKPLSGADLDQANNQLLIQRLHDVPAQHRSAHYACATALVTPGRPSLAAIGTCTGFIANEPRGKAGFGYDPIFLLPDLGRTFAEITAEEKNRRSHRARAFYALRAQMHYFSS
jgi:XTP/dITP diphosphohydrolase